MQRPHPDEGAPGTGSTSAGQKGFFSNKEGSATVSYSVNGKDGNTSYPMPVVQVTTHTLTFEKVWKYPSSVSAPTDDVILKVTYSDGTNGEITLKSAEGYKETISVPVTKTISTVTEMNEFADYTPSYQISEDRTKVTVTNNYSKITTQTIKVKKEWVGTNGQEPSVKIGLYQSVNGASATLYREVELSAPSWEYEWQVPLSEGQGETSKTYTYAVREINTPAGYSSSISYEFGENVTTATITNTYDPNCADEEYYMVNVLQTDDIIVSKTWEDNDNALGIRPESLSVTVSDGQNDQYNVNLTSDSWLKTIRVLEKKNAVYSATENLVSPNYKQKEYFVTATSKGTMISFVNELQSKDIIVKKEWKDDNLPTRPESISFELQYKTPESETWKKYGVYTLTEENIVYAEGETNGVTWALKIDNLLSNYEYRVEEINVASGYSSSVQQNGNTYTIVNTLKWSLKKTNFPDNSTDAVALQGAEFELHDNAGKLIATGISEENGVINWNSSVDKLDGEYILTETKAPTGYQKLSAEWTLTFDNGLLKDVTSVDNAYQNYISISKDAENGVIITVKNDTLYELPSTGGSGIFWYLISGTAFMMAASLILYRMKRKGVLGR